MSYRTIAQEHRLEDIIKGSRFIGQVFRAASIEEAQAKLALVRVLHADATHNCWAYRIGNDYRFSDDGEPGGTAGRPMLEVLTRRDLQYVLAVVTRYYGGTKLGAGGLVRAYGGTLAKTLDAAGVEEVLPRVSLRLSVSFSDMDAVHRYLASIPELVRGEMAYDAQGMVLELSLLESDREGLEAQLSDLTRGSAQVQEIEA